MCIVCCCPSGRTCTFIAAVITGLEAVLMAILNLIIILACSCNIEPSDSDHLKTEFMEKVWSWFIYDEENCLAKDDHFTSPPWIQGVPPEYANSSIFDLVEPSNNYTYQIIYLIVNVLWASSAGLLIFGTVSRRYKYYFPWIILCAVTIILDTIFGSFYIRLMDDLNPGWEDGQAIFAMQFLYFRGFVFYVYNIIAFFVVSFNCWDMFRKHRREQKIIKKAGRNPKPTVTIVAPHAEEHHYNQTFYQENVHMSEGPRRPGSPTVEFYDIEQSYQRPPAPSKYRPFSYTNPAYRPNDPHDVEGMKMNPSADPYTKDYAYGNKGFDDIEQMGTKIPRISLHHRS